MIAEVLVEINKIDHTFSYKIPNNLDIKIGSRVLVPFNNRQLEGFVMAIKDNIITDYEIKDILNSVDENPVLNEELVKLGEYMNKKTLSTLISCYQTMLPRALKANSNHITNIKKQLYIKKTKEYNPTTEKEKQLIDLLKEKGDISKVEANEISSYSVKKLLSLNVIEQYEKEIYRLEESGIEIKSDLQLTIEQIKAIEKVNLNIFKPYLIHGVTGSGKTEVYMQLIKQVIDNKKRVIVLVPEISLTPQFVQRFKQRFGSKIAILHSHLSNGEKYDEWRKIEKEEVDIVIGARSAIYAPLTNIGLIILDEEHSSTYKQENNPRYNAIDIALWRSKYYNCPLILGSATPSIESYTRAKNGIYELIEMKNRVNFKTNEIILVDMKEEIKKKNLIFSDILSKKIEEKLNKGEQIIILLNRRGYTTIVTCPNCGFTHKCKSCDIPFTYHLKKHKMVCHYCNLETDKLYKCPTCNNPLNERGMGTEKLEQELIKKFKNARVIRMDTDTTSTKKAHQTIVNDFENNKYDILIGTQMIAKGLDFPNVTLVGVINADSSLNIPDFRSSERTFELLYQVAGRAGRSKLDGQVIIQGFNVDHYSLICVKSHDYKAFYEYEMKIRNILKYPPFYNLTVIKITGISDDLCEIEGNKIVRYLKDNIKDTIILGPTASLQPKVNNNYCYQVILKYKDTKKIIEQLIFIQKQYLKNNKVNVSIDFNPNRI